MWILFGMFFWMFLIRPRRLRACQGWSTRDSSSTDEPLDPFDRPRRRGHRADLESALAERDALIAKLEERVRVLERIATDESSRDRLRAEIDALRDPPPRASS
jgi:hypothetical protein